MPEGTKKDKEDRQHGVTNSQDEREGHPGSIHSRDKAHQQRSEAGHRHPPEEPPARQHNEKKEIVKE